MTFHHSLYRDGAANVSDILGLLTATDNDLTISPQFVDSAGGNYQLTAASPCIDAGTPDTTGLHIGNTDLAGNARIVGAAIDIGAYEFNASTVPVHLIRFGGTIQNGTAILLWESGAESNLNRYVIEKSTNRSSFATVASVSAKGSNSSYTYSLMQPEPTAYYRLGMVDNDGKSRYSGIITLSQNGNGRISVYPNPAKDYIHVNVANASHVSVYNASGTLVKTQTVQAGLNKIDIHALSAGIYFIKINGEEIKFIKK